MIKSKYKSIETENTLNDKQRLADIGALTSKIAHELRNAMGVIRIAAYNIRQKAKNPLIETNLASIEKKISEGNQIIDNLLNYSEITQPNFGKINLYELLNECIYFFENKFNNYHVIIEKQFNSIKDFYIDSDSIQLRDVFNNILNNSYQSLPGNTGKIKISADFGNSGTDKTKTINISFKDSGIGINKKDLANIFQPFFTSKPKGIGLGLTICREIINLHGGEINVQSEENKGTTITVSLPVKKNKWEMGNEEVEKSQKKVESGN